MKRTRHSPEQIATKLRQAATHLACKAKHTVDLATEAVVSATVTTDRSDSQTGPGTLVLAQAALIQSSNHVAITEVVADKGYHDNSCWPTARSCWCAPIFLSGSKSTGGGQTSLWSMRLRSGPTGDAYRARKAGGFPGGAVSDANGPLPPCARPGAGTALGYMA